MNNLLNDTTQDRTGSSQTQNFGQATSIPVQSNLFQKNLDEIIDSTINTMKDVAQSDFTASKQEVINTSKQVTDIETQILSNNQEAKPKENVGEKIAYLDSVNRSKHISVMKNEFNELADLLTSKTNVVDKEFELDINPDCSNWLRVDHKKDNKYMKAFNNLENKNQIEEDDLDLLEMMDRAVEN